MFLSQSAAFFVYIRPFHNTMTNMTQFGDKRKKRRWCDWDSNPAMQDEPTELETTVYSDRLSIHYPPFLMRLITKSIFAARHK